MKNKRNLRFENLTKIDSYFISLLNLQVLKEDKQVLFIHFQFTEINFFQCLLELDSLALEQLHLLLNDVVLRAS
jgi:hypothetical protein